MLNKKNIDRFIREYEFVRKINDKLIIKKSKNNFTFFNLELYYTI